jgi:hypothetical protein
MLEVTMFVHAVYFWLKQNLGPNEKQEFLRRLKALATIESVHSSYIGEPAETLGRLSIIATPMLWW